MAYKETVYCKTREEAEAQKRLLDDQYGGFPCQGTTSIRECVLQKQGSTETYPGFEVTCTHYGTN